MANTKKVTGKRRGPKPKKTEYYVDPRELKQELINYYDSEECSRELGDMIHKIAHGLSFSSNFINYTYKDEMVGDALVKMYTAVTNKKFNVDSEYNPFSYFTTIAFHAFINRIKKEKKHAETLSQYKEKVYEAEMADSTDGMVYVKPLSDGSEDVDA
jgi:DNA-directed RNA polymerase specialized sigma24 family protein|tara:strand:- start:451 stop:921 length:471 start_codon:yes stop_codon:yes gene_type:complete